MESEQVRIGIDLNWGGAIREIWFEGQNVVNNYDGGRLIGVSFYDSDLRRGGGRGLGPRRTGSPA